MNLQQSLHRNTRAGTTIESKLSTSIATSKLTLKRSFILRTYIVPLQDTYLEALQVQLWR